MPQFDFSIAPRMAKRPRDPRGFPVPYFVAWVDGVPLFHVVDEEKWLRCVRHRRCWLCGEELGRRFAFVLGPMCTISRVTSEPPEHHDCAEFAARYCPFMVNPRMKRLPQSTLPEGYQPPAGVHVERNPGTYAIWSTASYQPFKVANGILIRVGDPLRVSWWREGKPADRATAVAAIEDGCPIVMQDAVKNGREYVADLIDGLRGLVPHMPDPVAGAPAEDVFPQAMARLQTALAEARAA